MRTVAAIALAAVLAPLPAFAGDDPSIRSTDSAGTAYAVHSRAATVAQPRAGARLTSTGGCADATAPGVEVCLAVDTAKRSSKAGADRRAAAAVPQWCQQLGTGATSMLRTEACTVSPGTLTVRRTQSGVTRVTGLMRFTVYQHTTTSVTSPVWTHQVTVTADFVSGDAKGTEVRGVADCSGECADHSQSFPLATLSASGASVSGESSFEWPVEFDERGTATPWWTLSFRAPPIAEPHPLDVPTAAEVRCDNELPGVSSPGCVFAASVPVITWYSSALPAYGRHIKEAQASGLPGSPGSGRPLHRLTNPAFQEVNRATSCPSSLPRPSDKSCDEYPFASTYEGGYTGGGTGGRTFEWCEIADSDTHRIGRTGPGFSACMIDEEENSGAGRELNTLLYIPYRVLDNDPFHVEIQ
ncbi:hypothetical protein BWI15_08490 [Kribbella sp. ALI-6-A]|nr:hypothetical protein BWI15_08490 [Kribbella sp. ALI-6-A]